jgi:IclR family pca regulon transcriptional regulator
MTRLRQDDADRRRAASLGPDHSEALARGLQILGAFDAAHRTQTLSQVAAQVGLPRATARRALLTLVALGYLELEDRQFRLTPRVLRLASAYLTSNPVSTLLQPACDRIARAVGESCSAAVLECHEVVMVARAVPAQLMPIGAGIGFRLPAYCSALGRVLLAALPDDAVAAYLARTDLAALTPHTLTRPADIAAAIDAVRAAGYCLADQEAEPGFRSVAVPIRRFDGTVIAALNIGARAGAADVATMTGRFLDQLRVTASELTGFLV